MVKLLRNEQEKSRFIANEFLKSSGNILIKKLNRKPMWEIENGKTEMVSG